jgi:hypothetical protein
MTATAKVGKEDQIRLVLFDFAIYWGMSEKGGNAYQRKFRFWHPIKARLWIRD